MTTRAKVWAGVALCCASAVFGETVVKVVPGEKALEKAQSEVRSILKKNGGRPPAGGIVVELADGVYRLSRPLELGARDAGAPDAPIVWRAANRGKATISGAAPGVPVAIDWSKRPASLVPEASRAHVRAFTLPGKPPYPGFRSGALRGKLTETPLTLHVGGTRYTVARWPNGAYNYAHTGKNVNPEVDRINEWGENWYANMDGMFHVDAPNLEKWAQEPDLWAYGMWRFEWSHSVTPVLKIDVAEKVMCVDTNQNAYGFLPDAPYYVFNAFSELDRPGEWVLDRTNGVAYVWLDDPAAVPEISLATRLVNSWGGLHDLAFEGLVFEGSRDLAIHLSEAQRVEIRASLIRRTGGDGINIRRSYNCRVSGCDLYDLGKAGIRLDGGEQKTLTPAQNVAENCHIHDFGVVTPTANPAICLNGTGCRAEHNLVHHFDHQGISFYGNDHYVGYNILHDGCRYNNDAGIIYCWQYDWSKRGSVIEYNTIFMSGKQPLSSHVNAIYLDGWSSGTTVRGNIINRAVLGVYMSGGNDNICVDNLVMNCRVGLVLSSLGADSFAKAAALAGEKSPLYQKLLKGREIYETELWRKRYPRILDILAMTNKVDAHNAYWYVVTNNLMTGTGGLEVRNKEKVMPTHFITNNVEISGDPGFVDYEGFNWSLRPDSPYCKLFGGNTRFAEMGLYASPNRFSPPVRHGENMSRPRPIRIEYNEGEIRVFLSSSKATLKRFRTLQATPDWRDYDYEYVPTEDGSVFLSLYGGIGFKTAYDSVRVTGATFVNGDFEDGDTGWDWIRGGKPSSDGCDEGPSGIVSAPELAASGTHVALVNDRFCMRQKMTTKKGVPIKIRLKARQWVPPYLKPYIQ